MFPLAGVLMGVLSASVAFFTRLWGSFYGMNCPADISIMESIWLILNWPARELFKLWVFQLRMPPQDNASVFCVLPVWAILVQWILIGCLIGIVVRLGQNISKRYPSTTPSVRPDQPSR